MIPTLKIDRDRLKANNFLNGYESDAMRDENYEDACYLLFHPKDVDKFREFLDSEYERTKDIIDDYDHPNGFVVVVYRLDPKFKSDFILIKSSLYSKTSPEFQAMFPKVVKIKVDGLTREEVSLQLRIFNKTGDLKKYWEDKFQVTLADHVEYWEGYHQKNEILTNQKLQQYLKKEEVI